MSKKGIVGVALIGIGGWATVIADGIKRSAKMDL